MMKIYGIKNCDTMKKAFRWLGERGKEYEFHDYRKNGIDETLVKKFVDELGMDAVLNKRGTTWRKLPDEIKVCSDEARLISLLVEYEALIKRPIIEIDEHLIVGFSQDEQNQLDGLLVK